ncbi:MAG: hypothetical protein ACREQM_02210 [Candidatus Dormibacteraceae bacterium]
MAGSGLVSADALSKQQAAQLQSYVNGDLPAALDKLTKLASQLDSNQHFQGKWANEYRTQAYPGIQKSTKAMQQDLANMSKSLSNIIANVLTAGGN